MDRVSALKRCEPLLLSGINTALCVITRHIVRLAGYIACHQRNREPLDPLFHLQLPLRADVSNQRGFWPQSYIYKRYED